MEDDFVATNRLEGAVDIALKMDHSESLLPLLELKKIEPRGLLCKTIQNHAHSTANMLLGNNYALKSADGITVKHIVRASDHGQEAIFTLLASTCEDVDMLGKAAKRLEGNNQYFCRLSHQFLPGNMPTIRAKFALLDFDEILNIEPEDISVGMEEILTIGDQFETNMRLQGHTLAFQQANGLIDDDYIEEQVDRDAPDIMQWIRERYRDARGAELPGTM